MKKILLLFVSCILISVSMQGQVNGVTLSPDTINILANSTPVQITATVDVEGSFSDSVEWILDERYSSIVAIDTTTTASDKECIIIPGMDGGEAKIVVMTKSGGHTATCVVNVFVPVTDMELDETTISLDLLENNNSSLVARILPLNATNDSVKWVSRNPSVVNIMSTEENQYDPNCYFEALKPGSVYIVGETVDGGFRDSCLVTVTAETILEFALNHDTIDMDKGSDTTLIVQIRPLEGTYKFADWEIEDTNILERTSVPGYDTIFDFRAKNVGTTKVIVIDYERQKKDTCVVRVHGIRLSGMSLDKDTIILDNKHKTDSLLTAILNPQDVTNDSIIWSTGDASIVRLDTTASNKYNPTCKIQAGYSGETYIYATAVDSVGVEHYKDTCYVRVIVPVDSIVLSADILGGVKFEENFRMIDMNLVADSVAKITATVYPDTATAEAYGPLVWRKFDPELSRLDATDDNTESTITALWSGVDTLVVTTADGTISSDYLFIHIDIRDVDSVKINVDEDLPVVEDTIQLNVNDSFELATTVYPWNATNDTLQLSVAGTNIVTVDSTENGVFVKALSSGTAIVYVAPTDGGSGKKDSCIIKVSSVPVSGISLNKDTVYVYENRMDSVLATVTPANATDKSVTWTSSDNTIVRVETSTGTDTLCLFKALKADTAVIRAEINGLKDSCVIIVKEQLVVIEADTTATNTGIIEFSLSIPTDVAFTGGSFELQLPKGFGLTRAEGDGYATVLADAFKESLDLDIIRLTDSTYIFDINPIVEPTSGSMLRSGTMTKVMDIAYTIYDNGLVGSSAIYTIKFKDVHFEFSDETEINEDQVDVEVKVYKSDTGNEMVDGQDASSAYLIDGSLYVNSDKMETIYVYSLNGSLVFTGNKTEGQAVFNVNTSEKVLIVKGSSGWASKVANR